MHTHTMNRADGIHARSSYHHDLSVSCSRPEYLTYIPYIYIHGAEGRHVCEGPYGEVLEVGWLAGWLSIHAMTDTNPRRIVARGGLLPLDWNWTLSLHQSFDSISSRAVLKTAFNRGWTHNQAVMLSLWKSEQELKHDP